MVFLIEVEYCCSFSIISLDESIMYVHGKLGFMMESRNLARLSEVESRTQGSRPRPRTGKISEAKAKDSLSEDRPSRGQGQGPRPQPQVFSKKKRSSKKFFRRSPIYRLSQNFWLRGPKPQITCNDVIKNFQKKKVLQGKGIVGWKIWNRCLLALNQDFAKRGGLN